MKIAETAYKFLASRALYAAIFSALSLLIIAMAISSFNWCFGVDNNPLLHAAFAMDKFGLLPYRDFFYMHMPGVQAYYLLIGKIFGYSYEGFRFADILFTAVFFASSILVLKKLNWKTAWGTSIFFCLLYFAGNNHFAMQRDYVLLLPVIFVILITIYFPAMAAKLKLVIGGSLCALSMLIKPQAVLIYPVIYLFQVWYFDDSFFKSPSLKKIAHSVIPSLTGFTFILSLAFLYLLLTGSLIEFSDTFLNFHPIYRKLYNPTGNALVPSPDSFSYYFYEHIKFGGQRLMLIPALIGTYIGLYRSTFVPAQKKLVYLFISLAIVFNVNVILAGKYFADHWLEFFYCLFTLSFLCFTQPSGFKKYKTAGRLMPLAAIYIIIFIKLVHNSATIMAELEFESSNDPVRERITDAAQFLKNNIKEGDRVLTLDMLSYSLASVMIAGAQQATSHVPPWYLNIPEISGEEFIVRKRSNFLRQMEKEKPRYILDFDGYRWFPEFQNILDTEYVKVPGKSYVIYARK